MSLGESWRAQGGRRNKNLFQSRVNTGKGDFTTKESLTSAHIFKPTETFQYTYFSSCNPHGVRKGLIKGEAIRLLRTNSSAKSVYENIYNFKKRLSARGYPHNLIEKITSDRVVTWYIRDPLIPIFLPFFWSLSPDKKLIPSMFYTKFWLRQLCVSPNIEYRTCSNGLMRKT